MSERTEHIVVPVEALRPGLFVSALDRPWVGTPFPLQGIRIDSDEDVAALKTWCSHCHVDPARSDPEVASALVSAAGAAPATVESGVPAGPLFEPVAHPDAERFAALVHEAAGVRAEAGRAVRAALDALEREDAVDVGRAQSAVAGMLRLVERDPSPVLWLTALRGHEPYAVTHGVNASALALAFGAHLGIDGATLEQVGLGTLLMDVGKTGVPRQVLDKRRALTKTERAFVRRHVRTGCARLAADGLPGPALEVVRCHHERVDGSGYPGGLAANAVPRTALIAGIADSYDAMLSWRPYRFPHRPEHALQRMFERAEQTFGRELLEEFVRCIGTFPVGSLVELDDGALGIVAGSQPGAGLWPTVLMLRAPDGRAFEKRLLLNLRAANESDSRIGARAIRRSVLESEADLDVADLVARAFELEAA